MLPETPKPHLYPLNPTYIHANNNFKEFQHLSTVPTQSEIIPTTESLLINPAQLKQNS